MKYLAFGLWVAAVLGIGSVLLTSCGDNGKKYTVLYIGGMGVTPVQQDKTRAEISAGQSSCGYNYTESSGAEIHCLNPYIVMEQK